MKKNLGVRLIITSLAIAAMMTCGLLLFLIFGRTYGRSPLPSLPAVITLLPAPSSTPPNLPPTFTSLPPTSSPVHQPTAEGFAVGAFVQVTGTGGDGLRLRSAPSLSAEAPYVADEAEVFQITDGPRQADGYTWWLLTAPYDDSRTGWAVQNYLTLLSP